MAEETNVVETGPLLAVAGSLNVDVFNYVERLPAPGETTRAKRHRVEAGGKGGNQAAMAGRIASGKGSVVMVGAVGNDMNAQIVMDNLTQAGVETKYIKKYDEESTGTAHITVDQAGENHIVLSGGANDLIAAEDLDPLEELFESCEVVVCQNEIRLESTVTALMLAKSSQRLTIFNPAPARPDFPGEIFKYTDVVVANQQEAAIMLGTAHLQFDSNQKLEDVAKRLEALGTFAVVVVTAGERGAVVVTLWDKEPIWVIPPKLEAPVVDTTGAGDCLIGAMAAHLAIELRQGRELTTQCVLDAVRIGTAAAALSVRKESAQASYPSASQVHALLDQDKTGKTNETSAPAQAAPPVHP
mmetsp:Transcript_2170/g.3608  ORF Transcript_2170/g.3608 Transcript_2170/m.3608 type:complete len:357 (+) Transcript_2170:275-1345(+)